MLVFSLHMLIFSIGIKQEVENLDLNMYIRSAGMSGNCIFCF